MGYALRARDPGIEMFIPLLTSLSCRDFLIIGAKGNNINVSQYFGGTEIMAHNYHLEKDKISKKRFLDVKNYLIEQSTKYPNKLVETKSRFSIDFAMDDGTRITYFLDDNKWEKIRKDDRTSIDILHREILYRISYSFEEKFTDIKDSSVDLGRCVGIRIKDRKCYNFQFMEYALTEVVDLHETDIGEKKPFYEIILKTFLKREVSERLDFILEMFIECKLRLYENYEIENEIKDLGIFQATLGKADFSSFFKRFIRNSEGLVNIPRQFQKNVSSGLYEADSKFFPIIGQYSSDLYMEEVKKTFGKQ
jgi:hypothetical protein